MSGPQRAAGALGEGGGTPRPASRLSLRTAWFWKTTRMWIWWDVWWRGVVERWVYEDDEVIGKIDVEEEG
jgi:hypothetical protein